MQLLLLLARAHQCSPIAVHYGKQRAASAIEVHAPFNSCSPADDACRFGHDIEPTGIHSAAMDARFEATIDRVTEPNAARPCCEAGAKGALSVPCRPCALREEPRPSFFAREGWHGHDAIVRHVHWSMKAPASHLAMEPDGDVDARRNGRNHWQGHWQQRRRHRPWQGQRCCVDTPWHCRGKCGSAIPNSAPSPWARWRRRHCCIDAGMTSGDRNVIPTPWPAVLHATAGAAGAVVSLLTSANDATSAF